MLSCGAVDVVLEENPRKFLECQDFARLLALKLAKCSIFYFDIPSSSALLSTAFYADMDQRSAGILKLAPFES